MANLRSTIAKLVGYLWTGVLGLLGWPVVFFGKGPTFAFGQFWAKGVLAISRIFAGVTWKVEGLENLPKNPYILASKHQSFFDTVVWSLLIPDAAYVMKEELLSQPIFGWFIRRLDIVALDRSAGLSSLKKLLVDSAAKADQGLPVIIFPEGTRTIPGVKGRYHPGVAAMYEKLALPVVPVGTDSGVFWDRGFKGLKAGQITVSIQPPIMPGLDKRTFLNSVSNTIEDASLRLLPEGYEPEQLQAQAQTKGVSADK
ncbi:MAG: 1-acyl-sn-glycerol-3-phosphate acyltransferase [Geminicoccus sp.]|jgi:1-acyl-sn-glycerol-3-phosphate acyltransferase|nr:1-acyl-sn-glycerol-3-phosphate acyltransferase [Geminicoccus sp.]